MQRKSAASQWQEFYQYRLSIQASFSDISMPLFFWRFRHSIFVPKGISCSFLFDAYGELFPDSYALKNQCLDIQDERSTTETYFVQIACNEKRDDFLFEKSAGDIQKMRIDTLTLLECLLWILQFQHQYRKFPTKNYILCAGTRDRYDSIPRVTCNAQTLKIEFVGVHVKGELLHARRVFAL